MSLILLLVIGGFAGWVASKIMATEHQQGIFLNIIVGIVGAFIGNWLIAPLVGHPAVIDRLDFVGFILAVLGACILLAIVNLVQRGRVR